jgi:hypothetical protein
MVSATINEASKNPRLNKDGSVKKRAGRKAKVSNLSTVERLEPETKIYPLHDAHTSVVDGHMSQNELRNEIMGELQQNFQNT